MSTTIVNTKVASYRGSKRLWMEGAKLQRNGFIPGASFSVAKNDVEKSITLIIDPNGKFSVAERNKNNPDKPSKPIIDLKRQGVLGSFKEEQLVRATIYKNKIVVTIHQQEFKEKGRVERLRRKLQTKTPLDVCSLFHGGGVLDSAIHCGLKKSKVSSRVSIAVEIEPKYLDSSLRNNKELFDSNSLIIESDIRHVDVLKNQTTTCDILIGGIPCTGASKGNRNGITKPKGGSTESHVDSGALFYYFLNFVQSLEPSCIVLENVREFSNSASMQVINSVLDFLGYHVQQRIFGGNEFGTLEDRYRLGLVAISKDITGFDIDDVLPCRLKEDDLAAILEEVSLDSTRWKELAYLTAKVEREKKAGKAVFKPQILTGAESKCGVIGRQYHKYRVTEPMIAHPKNDKLKRLFTPTEHCLVKGIPPFIISGNSDTISHEILGQSVSYPVFEELAYTLGKSLNEWAKDTNVDLAA
ncbi:DNA cytosine methyltransferase [Vibrio crassostreae]|uniref:DNA cytosine methyltransferase n=1 Tax=Vibrio crassostreae TaxID=246167 RepID=UPI001B31305A|nr:DNA cytosine methyltransferase [Vibrio crassostreae]